METPPQVREVADDFGALNRLGQVVVDVQPGDRAERERILRRIAAPPPKPKHRWLAALVVVLLSLGVVAGTAVWRWASATAAKPAAVPTTQVSPATSQGGG